MTILPLTTSQLPTSTRTVGNRLSSVKLSPDFQRTGQVITRIARDAVAHQADRTSVVDLIQRGQQDAVGRTEGSKVAAVVDWFGALNPYAFGGSILNVEKVNFALDDGKRSEPLFCWAVSAKRYALFNVGNDGAPIMRKVSAHAVHAEAGTAVLGPNASPSKCVKAL